MKNVKKNKKALLALGLVALFVIIAIPSYIIYSNLFLGSKNDSPKQQETAPQVEKKEPFFKAPVNILVMGIDQRGEEKSRTDTIMVYRLDPITKEIRLLSIPRDTYVNIPGRGMDKINHAHAFGEVELTIQTVEEFLDIKIDHYLKTNFEGFKGLIDLIGGVTIDVEKNITGTDIKPGLQTLTSEEALAYVRDRKDPMGDIARVKRQQKFIKALGDGVGKFEPKWKLIQVAPKLYSNVDTDIPVKAGEELIAILRGVDMEKSEIEVIPGWFYNKNGVSYWKPDDAETKEVVSKIFKEEAPISGSETSREKSTK